MKVLVAGEVCPRMHALDSVLFAKLAAGENHVAHATGRQQERAYSPPIEIGAL